MYDHRMPRVKGLRKVASRGHLRLFATHFAPLQAHMSGWHDHSKLGVLLLWPHNLRAMGVKYREPYVADAAAVKCIECPFR
jgi:hypothetical protein